VVIKYFVFQILPDDKQLDCKMGKSQENRARELDEEALAKVGCLSVFCSFDMLIVEKTQRSNTANVSSAHFESAP
jgi:hypothetical protein